MALAKRLVGLVVLLLALYFRSYLYLIYAVPVAAVQSVAGAIAGPSHPSLDESSIKRMMRNVTTDYHQLATLMQEFVTSPDAPPETEVRLREFLAVKASRSFPRLESSLDWVLRIYQYALPFLLMALAMSCCKGADKTEELDSAASLSQPASHYTSRRSSAGRGAGRGISQSLTDAGNHGADRSISRRDPGASSSVPGGSRMVGGRGDTNHVSRRHTPGLPPVPR